MSSPLVSAAVQSSAFAQSKATKSLRVCCFGSSSSQTPEAYLKPSAEVGYLLAVRGHICVNGAGNYGCMGALNQGAVAGNGHIVGVIHEYVQHSCSANDFYEFTDIIFGTFALETECG